MTTTYRIQFTDPDTDATTSEVMLAPDFTSDHNGNWLPHALSKYAADQSKMHLNNGNYCSMMSNVKTDTTYRRQIVSVYAVTVGSVGRKAADSPSYERLIVKYSHVRIKYTGSDPIYEPSRLF